MKPEVNAVLAEVKQSLAQAHQPAPLMPDFKAMSIMQATKWCIENGIISPKVISEKTGKGVNTVNTALIRRWHGNPMERCNPKTRCVP